MRYGKFALVVVLLAAFAQMAAAGPLQDVKTIEVDPTVVPHPRKVKDAAAPKLVRNYLREALREAGFEIGESPVKAHMVLDEFNSGNITRHLIGFGAGRSAIMARLVIHNGRKNEIVDAPIHVRGNIEWSAYEVGRTQRHQAEDKFQRLILQEIQATIWKVSKHEYAGRYTAVIVPPFTLAPGVEFSSKDLTKLQKDIVMRLQQVGFQHVMTAPEAVPPGSTAIQLTGMVIQFKPGNRATRYMGGGIGQADLETSVTLTDAATGRILLERQLGSSTIKMLPGPLAVAQSSKRGGGLAQKLAVLLKDYFF